MQIKNIYNRFLKRGGERAHKSLKNRVRCLGWMIPARDIALQRERRLEDERTAVRDRIRERLLEMQENDVAIVEGCEVRRSGARTWRVWHDPKLRHEVFEQAGVESAVWEIFRRVRWSKS